MPSFVTGLHRFPPFLLNTHKVNWDTIFNQLNNNKKTIEDRFFELLMNISSLTRKINLKKKHLAAEKSPGTSSSHRPINNPRWTLLLATFLILFFLIFFFVFCVFTLLTFKLILSLCEYYFEMAFDSFYRSIYLSCSLYKFGPTQSTFVIKSWCQPEKKKLSSS